MAALTSIAVIANTVNTRISREAAKIHLAARAMLRPGRWRPKRGIVSPPSPQPKPEARNAEK